MAAFTMAEFLVMLSVFMMVITGTLAVQLFGLKVSSKMQIKLNATDDARQTMGTLVEDIRSATSMAIGNGTMTTFTNATDGSNQVGNALMIFPSSDTNVWIRYFYNKANNLLEKTTNGASSYYVSANNITNDTVLFKEEDYLGNVITNKSPIAIVNVTLSFTKLVSPLVPIGPGNYFDFYQLKLRVSPRVRP